MGFIFLDQATGLPPAVMITSAVSVIAVVLFAIFAVKSIRNGEKASSYADNVKRIANSVGAGLFEYAPAREGFVVYANTRFYELIGLTKDEFVEKFGNSFFSLLSPENRSLLDNFYTEDGEQKLKTEIKLRARKRSKSGEIGFVTRYLLITGNVKNKKDGSITVSAVMVDVTRERELDEKLRIEQERYRLATELSNDIIFDYRYADDVLEFSGSYEYLLGEGKYVENFLQDRTYRDRLIHSEDYPAFRQFFEDVKKGVSDNDEQLRILAKDGNYIWCKILAKAIGSPEGQGVEIIGKLINIDRQKKELSAMTQKAMRDPMTGAFNKESTKDLVQSYMQRYQDTPAMFIIIDIDKFKNVNDTYGHIMGDKILIRAVSEMTKAFRADDIIGRIGGDEFVVFVGNIRSKEILIKQAQKLQAVLRTPAVFDDVTIPMSASIGISLYPEHGKNYEDLLACADRALYEVKGTTRDAFRVYDGRPV